MMLLVELVKNQETREPFGPRTTLNQGSGLAFSNVGSWVASTFRSTSRLR